jgi:hypothetical protein
MHDQHQALSDVLEVGFRRQVADCEEPARRPAQGVAAVLVVDRKGREQVKPVIVTDFYREEPQR